VSPFRENDILLFLVKRVIWNDLLDDVTSAESLHIFRQRL